MSKTVVSLTQEQRVLLKSIGVFEAGGSCINVTVTQLIQDKIYSCIDTPYYSFTIHI
jgi:hypothetical protein